MRSLTRLALLALLGLGACAIHPGRVHQVRFASDAETVLASTQAGVVRGVEGAGVRAFLGVPYARPPVGELRWRAPQPVEPWRGERDATRIGPDCTQAIGRRAILGGGGGIVVGTAVMNVCTFGFTIVAAGILNGLELAGKSIETAKIVTSGAGAAAPVSQDGAAFLATRSLSSVGAAAGVAAAAGAACSASAWGADSSAGASSAGASSTAGASSATASSAASSRVTSPVMNRARSPRAATASAQVRMAARGLPCAASRSTAGPPGKPRPITLADLSKASPAALLPATCRNPCATRACSPSTWDR